MPAINSVVARDALNQLAARSNFASREPGVMVVFCIVGIVGLSLAFFIIYRIISRKMAERSAKRAASQV